MDFGCFEDLDLKGMASYNAFNIKSKWTYDYVRNTLEM